MWFVHHVLRPIKATQRSQILLTLDRRLSSSEFDHAVSFLSPDYHEFMIFLNSEHAFGWNNMAELMTTKLSALLIPITYLLVMVLP